MKKRIYWGDHTSWEIKDLVTRDPVVLLPVCAYEQHGPHLAMNTDMVIGQRICEGIVEQCIAPCVMLPPIWCGISEHHMQFSGSVTEKHDSMSAYVFDILDSLARNGVTKVLVVNSHGGNMVAVNEALTKVAYLHQGTYALLTYWNLLDQAVKNFRRSEFGGISHACELETSLQMFLAPENVRSDRLPLANNQKGGRFWSPAMFASNKITMYVPFDRLSEEGHIGDPQSATREFGEALYDTVCREGAVLVTAIHKGEVLN